MKIAIDIRPAQYCPRRGFGRFTRGIVKGLQAVDGANKYVLLYSPVVPLTDDLLGLATRPNFHFNRWKGRWGRRFDVLFFSDMLRFKALRLPDLDIFLAPIPFAVPIRWRPMVVVIHDLNPVVWQKRKHLRYDFRQRLFRLLSDMNLAMRQKLEKRTARRHFVIVPSKNTYDDLQKLWHISADALSVIEEGVDECFRPLPQVDWSLLAKWDIVPETPFFVYVGVIAWHKNLFGLVEAFNKLRSNKELRLLLVGDILGGNGRPSADFYNLRRKISKLGLEDRVILTGGMSDEALVNLLNAAVGCVLPSFFEGFGLPVLEAMACGCPVIASNVSSLPEVGGDAALYCDPYSSDSIAFTMCQLLEQNGIQEQMRVKGLERAKNYTWEQTARRLVEFFEIIYEKNLKEKRFVT